MSDLVDRWTNPVIAGIEDKADELVALIRAAGRKHWATWSEDEIRAFHLQVRESAKWMLFYSNDVQEQRPMHNLGKAQISIIQPE